MELASIAKAATLPSPGSTTEASTADPVAFNFTTVARVPGEVLGLDGTPIQVPAGIGIDTKEKGVLGNPTADGTGKDYQVGVCAVPCLSELHTHAPDGILHSESQVANQKPATLGQFFTEWGVRLDDQCVGEFCSSNTAIAVYVNGQKASGNPADIELKTHLEIAVVIGKSPAQVPSSWPFLEDEP